MKRSHVLFPDTRSPDELIADGLSDPKVWVAAVWTVVAAVLLLSSYLLVG